MLKLLNQKRHPQETMLIVAMIGMSVVFLFLSIAYLSTKGTKGWVDFMLPKMFGFSTFFILVSSYTLYIANVAFKKEDFFTYRYMLGVTVFLGVLFVVSQIVAWKQLELQGLFFRKGKVSVGYLYVISGLHILHLIAGMVALGILFWQAIKKMEYVDSFVYSVNPPNQRRLYLSTIFWHFLGILWLYLYFFFYIQH